MSLLKIHSGIHRGMPLQAPKGLTTRPSKSMVRDAVMNMLQSIDEEGLADKVIWDLFAGTGAMGLEAISRGAAAAVFFESDRQAVSALQKNIEEIKRRCQRQQVSEPDLRVIRTALSAKQTFQGLPTPEVIWLDPPYELVPKLIPALFLQIDRHLSGPFHILLESGSDDSSPDGQIDAELVVPESWQLTKQRSYGKTQIQWWFRPATDNTGFPYDDPNA